MQNHPPACVRSMDQQQHTATHLEQEMMSVTPALTQSSQCSGRHHPTFPEASFEDEVEDEDLTDEECQFSFETFVRNKAENEQHEKNTATAQLLTFLEMVNKDINKYFGRNKGNDDACDVYQDKWTSGKSGRELYYADLMKIAQGLDTEDVKVPLVNSADASLDQSKNHQRDDDQTDVATHTGRLDSSIGLGPFEGLFQNDIKTGSGVRKIGPSKNGKRQQFKGRQSKGNNTQQDSSITKRMLPMVERKLPQSFWSEPRQTIKHVFLNQTKLNCGAENFRRGNGNIVSNKLAVNQRRLNGNAEPLGHQSNIPPDFADLLDSWGDVTHLVASCTPSGQQQHYGHHGVPNT